VIEFLGSDSRARPQHYAFSILRRADEAIELNSVRSVFDRSLTGFD
jgi:hypothetical protein